MSKSFRVVGVIAALMLMMVASASHAKPYKGAEIGSTQSYKYGRYEMRMRVAKISGVLSTFFLYKSGSEVSGAFWEEVDIEVFGKNNATQWQSNVILGNPHVNAESVHTVDGNLADAYHTYVLEWTPDYLAWFVDGVEIRRISGTSTVTSLTNAETVRFNLWSSTSETWAGTFDGSQLPVYQFVNYIEYKSYNTTTKAFETGWRDDFNTFDTTRWNKANWTFAENRADFAPENALVKDGTLVLALTAEGATGFTGTVPADDGSSASSTAVSSSVASSAAVSSTPTSSVASSTAPSSIAASSQAASSVVGTTTSGSGSSGGGGSVGWLELLCLGATLWFSRRRV